MLLLVTRHSLLATSSLEAAERASGDLPPDSAAGAQAAEGARKQTQTPGTE